MIKPYLRRIFASLGYDVHRLGLFDAAIAQRDRLVAEVERLRGIEQTLTGERNRLTEEVEWLRGIEQTLIGERSRLTEEIGDLHRNHQNQFGQLIRLRAGPLAGELFLDPLTASAKGQAEPFDVQSRLIERLRGHGMSVAGDEPVFLHVGFGHSGTTSLQLNFFSRRPDLHYLGTPYGKAGGLLSNLKYLDDYRLDEPKIIRCCRDVAYGSPERQGRPIVISDETICDSSEIYYCPRHVPSDVVAARLKCCFPTAKILFTIRNQAEYVSSMYYNLKRNYAFLAGMSMPSFDEWWAGMHTQLQNQYLQNLDYYRLIDHYGKLFGRENLLILTLEELRKHGARPYLEKLCRFMKLELRVCDVDDFNIPRNERMTVVESRLADLVTGGAAQWAAAAKELLEKESLANLVSKAPRLSVEFTDDQREMIRQSVVPGNQRLAAEFNLPLEELGYLVS
ncbi:MAG: hypothetical protein EXS05_00600 [Planctomycetaceae bacterium]|nr:hypothetical protein [Planctomycetaceae bacterium]